MATPFSTPGITGINFGGSSGGPFGGVSIDPSQLPDDLGDVRDVAGDLLRDEGGDFLSALGSEFGIDTGGQASSGTPTGNAGLNFSEPTGGQSSGPPVAPVDSGSIVEQALFAVVGGALVFGALAFFGIVDA